MWIGVWFICWRCSASKISISNWENETKCFDYCALSANANWSIWCEKHDRENDDLCKRYLSYENARRVSIVFLLTCITTTYYASKLGIETLYRACVWHAMDVIECQCNRQYCGCVCKQRFEANHLWYFLSMRRCRLLSASLAHRWWERHGAHKHNDLVNGDFESRLYRSKTRAGSQRISFCAELFLQCVWQRAAFLLRFHCSISLSTSDLVHVYSTEYTVIVLPLWAKRSKHGKRQPTDSEAIANNFSNGDQ